MQQSSLQEKLKSFYGGEYQVLLDRNVTGALPATILHLLDTEKDRVAERLIELLITGLSNSEASIRKMCGSCLVQTAALLTENKIWGQLDKLIPSLRIMQQDEPDVDLPENVRGSAAKIIAAAENRNAVKKPAVPVQNNEKKDDLAVREEQIFHLHRAGNIDEAKQQLFELVVACARKKDFRNAERLQERIYEIDPMALKEIVQSGEIIEEEKSGAIDKDLLQVWFRLLQTLTLDEFNSLYLTMAQRIINAEEILVSQGTKNDEVFFIHSGSLRISYFQTGAGGGKEIFLENLSSGEIACENFFNATFWTVTLTAVQQVRISILKQDDLTQLEQKHPGIESKLLDYYIRSMNIAQLLNRKGLNRRVHERFKVKRKIQLQITGKQEKVLSSFKGDLDNISLGGLSFNVMITKKENSSLLLGRNISATIPFSHWGEEKVCGKVIGVHFHDRINDNYSVHIKFNNELDRNTLKLIIE
ncbi:MAG: cyclic nucleotide-binding domain-containing protein [Desulfobulbaceae bacterium]|nr:cyclic nucleotide-binding domain-containing protein [Desulfobulbaceae bacterium]